jgi:putative ABC transport system permease protein
MQDYIEGDFMEVYERRLTSSGKRKADLRFIDDVLLLLRPGIIKPIEGSQNLNTYGMYKSYFKIGWRNLKKNKLFSLINISGMTISVTSFLLIALFMHDELQFDKHVDGYSNKYRVYTEGLAEDGSLRKRSMIPPVIAPTAAAAFPEIESYTRFLNFNYPILIKVGDKKMSEHKGGYADPTIFDMFSLKLVEGDVRTALKEPNTIAISNTLKQKYFGDKPALGELIQIGDFSNEIVAVFEDFSTHSHLQLNYFLSMEEFIRGQADRMQRWTWSQFHTYVKLKEGVNVAQLENKMGDMVIRYTPDEERRFLPRLMPIEKIHLYAYDHLWDIAVRGNVQTFYILLATAILIIVITVLNFVNLSTARAVTRSKEVGVRKVMGAFRTQLINQFISESVLITVIALVLAGGAVSLALPFLNGFTGKAIPLNLLIDPFALACLAVFTLFIGVAAGAYPAFYISGYNPVQILSRKSPGRSGKTILRKGLVVFQFILSFILIIAASVVSDQYTYMRTAKMGFDKENLIIVQLRGEMKRNLEATKQAFLNHPGIISGSMGYGLPGEAFAGDGIINKVTNKKMGVSMLTVDHDYVETLGLELIAGRDFSTEFPSDEKDAFLVSEQTARLLGYHEPQEAVGHEVAWNRWDAPDSLKEGKVVGVVKDIQLNSMRETIGPVILHVYPFAYNTITMKVDANNVPATIDHLEKTWKSFNTEWPFEYRFLDENFDRMYKSEERLAVLFTWFTMFAILIACLGLFGLVVFNTSQKFREISIRKVLGAREATLVVQLGKSYLTLLAMSFVIAIPFSYYAAGVWLQEFAFRIQITPILFIRAALFIMVISFLTVGIQSFKAARTNPVDALKE